MSARPRRVRAGGQGGLGLVLVVIQRVLSRVGHLNQLDPAAIAQPHLTLAIL